jgi:hypothetical protein
VEPAVESITISMSGATGLWYPGGIVTGSEQGARTAARARGMREGILMAFLLSYVGTFDRSLYHLQFFARKWKKAAAHLFHDIIWILYI